MNGPFNYCECPRTDLYANIKIFQTKRLLIRIPLLHCLNATHKLIKLVIRMFLLNVVQIDILIYFM